MAAMKRVKLLVRYGNYNGELSPTAPRANWALRLWGLLVAAVGLALLFKHR